MVILIAQLPKEEPSEDAGGDKFTVQPAKGDLGTAHHGLWESIKARKDRPNKQKRGWLDKARVEDMKTLLEQRRERRAKWNISPHEPGTKCNGKDLSALACQPERF
jgi:hypothetical protein